MKIAVCPGSFDPVTRGHLDIIERAAKLFDRVIVLVAKNSAKQYCFSEEERIAQIRICTGYLPEVKVESFSGLLADYVEKAGASAIIKGLRAVSDFDFEFQQAMANKRLNHNAETVFLTTSPENMFVSSSLVREVAGFGGDISQFVPPQIVQEIYGRFFPDEIQNSIDN